MKRIFLLCGLLALLPQAARALRVYDNGVYRTETPAALRRMEHAIIRADQQTWRANPLSAANAATWNLIGGGPRWRLDSSSVSRRVLDAVRGPGQAVYEVIHAGGSMATTRLTVSHRTYQILLRRPLADAWYVTSVRRVK